MVPASKLRKSFQKNPKLINPSATATSPPINAVMLILLHVKYL